jgi:hypothetical protein
MMMETTTSNSTIEKASVPGNDGAFILDVCMVREILISVIGSSARVE